jgi:hypothetical protein
MCTIYQTIEIDSTDFAVAKTIIDNTTTFIKQNHESLKMIGYEEEGVEQQPGSGITLKQWTDICIKGSQIKITTYHSRFDVLMSVITVG